VGHQHDGSRIHSSTWTDTLPKKIKIEKYELSGSAFKKKGLTIQPANKSTEDLVLHSGFFP